MKPLSAAALANLLAAVAAFDPAADFCSEDGGVCLTSFIWCNNQSPARCAWPADVDPLGSDGTPYGVVYRGRTYEVTWRRAASGRPVLVQWWSEVKGAKDDLTLLWSTNSTGNSVEFDPQRILEELSPSGFTVEQALYGTEGIGNFIKISQPGDSKVAASQQFTVQGSWMQQLVMNMNDRFDEERAAAEKKWKLGVGIGVGLGVPLLTGLIWFLTSRGLGRKTATKTTD